MIHIYRMHYAINKYMLTIRVYQIINLLLLSANTPTDYCKARFIDLRFSCFAFRAAIPMIIPPIEKKRKFGPTMFLCNNLPLILYEW